MLPSAATQNPCGKPLVELRISLRVALERLISNRLAVVPRTFSVTVPLPTSDPAARGGGAASVTSLIWLIPARAESARVARATAWGSLVGVVEVEGVCAAAACRKNPNQIARMESG